MRIAFDVSVQGLPHPTGVERAQATLISALLSQPADLELLLLSPLRATPGEEGWLADARVRRGALSALPLALWRESVVPQELAAWRADLLHSPVAAIPLRTACPAIATVYELPWRDGSPGERRLAHRLRAVLAESRAWRVVCATARVADLLDAPGRVRVVPLGVDPRFTPGAPGPRGPLLAVGRLRRKKNLGALLDALALHPGRRLVLAGPPGDAEAELRRRAAASDLAGRVDFAGCVGDERLVDLYRSAACLVHPALAEGFGLPVVEAMACGTPVVASRQGAAPEAVGEAALVCDGRSPGELGAAIARVLSDPAPWIERGLAQAATLDAARHAQRMLALYAEARG